MWAKWTAQKDISKHMALFPALQSWQFTLPSYNLCPDHRLRTSDTNLGFCSHKHGPNFLQLFGFPLCFFLEAGVLLLNVQAFLLYATFSRHPHINIIKETICNSTNKRKNYLNKTKHLPRAQRPGSDPQWSHYPTSEHCQYSVSKAVSFCYAFRVELHFIHVSNAKAHNTVCLAIVISRQLLHITPPPSPQAPCEAVLLSSFVLPVPYLILPEASLAPLLLPASPLLPQSPSSPMQTVSPTGTGALV